MNTSSLLRVTYFSKRSMFTGAHGAHTVSSSMAHGHHLAVSTTQMGSQVTLGFCDWAMPAPGHGGWHRSARWAETAAQPLVLLTSSVSSSSRLRASWPTQFPQTGPKLQRESQATTQTVNLAGPRPLCPAVRHRQCHGQHPKLPQWLWSPQMVLPGN